VINLFQRGSASFNRIVEPFDANPEIQSGPPRSFRAAPRRARVPRPLHHPGGAERAAA
jgi:hypothetical protein